MGIVLSSAKLYKASLSSLVKLATSSPEDSGTLRFEQFPKSFKKLVNLMKIKLFKI